MRKLVAAAGLSVLLVAALVASGCGSSKKGGAGKKGGEITILEAAGGVDSLDPGYWYYQTDTEELQQTTQRMLYDFKPEETTPRPGLAASALILLRSPGRYPPTGWQRVLLLRATEVVLIDLAPERG